MPKRLKKATQSKDANQAAHAIVRALTERVETEANTERLKPPKGLSAYMSALGRKGGQVSGERRMKNLTDEQRQEIALKAARARWAKRSTQVKNKRKPL